jgi:hypothetical protein
MLFSYSNLPSRFYVYAYLREDRTPYYIGKGKGDRAWIKHSNEIKPPKDKTRVIITHADLTEVGAFMLERWLIRWYGRKDLGTGILRNKTDGGEGSSGCIKLRGVPKSESHKKNISKARLGKKYPKLSASKRGKSQTKESNNLRSSTLKGKLKPQRRLSCIHCRKNLFWKKIYEHTCEVKIKANKKIKDGEIIKIKSKMPAGKNHYKYNPTIFTFAHLDGTIEKMPANDFSLKYNLDRGWLSNVILGHRKTIKGWKVMMLPL